MRKLLLAITTLLIAEAFLYNCANPTPPTGGVKDTIPPRLVHSYPADQTLNFKEKTITLTFDEFVTAEKIKQNLIITPITDINYKVLPKKESVTLRFEDAFDDSTTYTLNFFAGITDITERNPAENLILAFSTTNYIDSLKIFGRITNVYTGKPEKKMTVGLYRITDSLDLTSHKPTYFFNTDDNGAFQIQNIKNNRYILHAFLDENKNLLFDAGTETYAFVGDTIDLQQSPEDSIYLHSLSIDASPLKFISARPSGRYFETRYSKQLVAYDIEFPLNERGPASNFGSESQSIQFYNNLSLQETDSIFTILTVQDSLKNSRIDTVYVKFRESARKAPEYKASVVPASGAINRDTRFRINFTKPTRINPDSLVLNIPLDTLFDLAIPAYNARFNFNHTSYSFTLPPTLQKDLLDTLEALKAEYIQTDTLNIDTAKHMIYRQLNRIKSNTLKLQIPASTFISVEEDTLALLTGNYNFPSAEDFGNVQVTINTEQPSYFVQLISKDKVVQQQAKCQVCNFSSVPPGSYWIRILIDENNDGKWSPGNFQQFIAPEPVVHFTEQSSLRSNWVVELQYSF